MKEPDTITGPGSEATKGLVSPSSLFLSIPPAGMPLKHNSLKEALAAVADAGEKGYVWFNLTRASRDELNKLTTPLNLHPLSIEDCFDEINMPKADEYPGYTFIVFNTMHHEDDELVTDEVDFFIGRNFLVTVSGNGDDPHFPLEDILSVVERNIQAVRQGPAWLMHVITDFIVDRMADVVEQAETWTDRAEEEIIAATEGFDPSRLIFLRRNLLNLRKNLFYEREVLVKICRSDSEWIPAKATVHYRDILDHITNFLEITESNRDNVISLTELYASMVNNQMARDANQTNATVRRLTLITTIFMPMTLLAGIFGMSEWTLMTGGADGIRRSYPLMAAIMVLLGLGGYLFIRWLERRDRRRAGLPEKNG